MVTNALTLVIERHCGHGLKPLSWVVMWSPALTPQDAVEGTLAEVEDASSAELFEIGLVDSMENVSATLLLTVTPTLAVSGQTIGVICIGQDITKLKDWDVTG